MGHLIAEGIDGSPAGVKHEIRGGYLGSGPVTPTPRSAYPSLTSEHLPSTHDKCCFDTLAAICHAQFLIARLRSSKHTME